MKLSNGVENYGWATAEGPESCHYITPQILRILVPLHVQRLCDLGSGNGALTGALASRGYYVVGVDGDQEGVQLAREHYPGVHFYNLRVENDPQCILDKEGEQFDAVVSTEVIEHLYSPHLLPIFAKKLLRTGGYLVISTPYHGYFKNLALSLVDKWDDHHTPLWHGGHIKFWSRKTLTQLLEDNGFTVEGFYGVGRMPLLWKSMVLVARAK